MASDDPADWHERLSRYSEIRNVDQIYPMRSLAFGPGSSASPPWPSHPVGRVVWLVTSEAEVWMPARAELEDHVAALEEERRRTSPVQAVEMPVTTGRTRSGDRHGFPRSGKWTENAADLLGG